MIYYKYSQPGDLNTTPDAGALELLLKGEATCSMMMMMMIIIVIVIIIIIIISIIISSSSSTIIVIIIIAVHSCIHLPTQPATITFVAEVPSVPSLSISLSLSLFSAFSLAFSFLLPPPPPLSLSLRPPLRLNRISPSLPLP